MEAKVENLKKGKVKLSINLEPKEMITYFNKAYKRIAPSIKIDGFRPGKAPRKLIESAIGLSRLLSESLDMAVSESYAEVIRKNNIVPITSPNIVINKYPNYSEDVNEVKDGFEFEVELEVLPEVILNDYSKVKVKKSDLKKAKKEDVEKVIEHFRKQNANLKEVTRMAQKGDRVEINFEGFLKKVRIDQMSSKNHPLILGEGSLIPGFEENLIGMKKGEKKEFKIKFPKDYHAKEYADKDAEFKVEMVDIKEVELPKVDKTFAERFGHNDVESLFQAIEKNLNDELKEENDRKTESEVLEAVLPYLKVELPDSLIDREADRMIAEFAGQLQAQGIHFDRYLESMKKDREQLKKEMMPQAEKNVKVGLLLGKIIEENKWDQHEPTIGKKAIDYIIEKTQK